MPDSTELTKKHIAQVNENCDKFIALLKDQVLKHDASKLEDPEKPYFDEYSPELTGIEYGTPEYEESKRKIKPALDHHYAVNSHHPEFYKNGIAGMTLYDLLELWFDWNAAVKRNKNGDIMKSLEINKKRFKIDDQLASILENTARLESAPHSIVQKVNLKIKVK